MYKYLITLTCIFLCVCENYGQNASDCSGAIPICANTPIYGTVSGFGIDDYIGVEKSGCLEKTENGTIESNSLWYTFKTGASGQLGFNLKFDGNDDWDFALYKADNCTQIGSPVRCDFSDNKHENIGYAGVGVHPLTGTQTVQYDEWLDVQGGETYYLMVNNFSNTNSGFSIQFTGSIFANHPNTALDCSIVTNLLGAPKAACLGENVILDATAVTSTNNYAWSVDMGSGFTILPETSGLLTVTTNGTYRVEIDGQNSEVIVHFYEAPIAIGSITDITICDDNTTDGKTSFDLSKKDAQVLGMQSVNDFQVSYHSNFTDAQNGSNPLPKNYTNSNAFGETIYVRKASAFSSYCAAVYSSFDLVVVESPALELPSKVYLCENSGVEIGESSSNILYQYFWNTGATTSSITVNTAGNYSLTVSNAVGTVSCAKEFTIEVVASTKPEIKSITISDISTNNSVIVDLKQEGNFEYSLDGEEYQDDSGFYNVAAGAYKLYVKDKNGCGEITQDIVVTGFPKVFTPNGDGINDLWHLEGMDQLTNPVVHIFDRYGKLLAKLDPDSKGWDGTYRGIDLPSSDYWFQLEYVTADGNTAISKYLENHFSLRR